MKNPKIVYSTFMPCQNNDHQNCAFEVKVLNNLLKCDCDCHKQKPEAPEKTEIYKNESV